MAGALAGLVFVTISINLAHIIKWPDVIGRAAETIILLAGAMAGTLVALLPHLSAAQLGVALAVVTVPTWLGPLVIQLRSTRVDAQHGTALFALRATLHQTATLPGVLAAASLCGALPGGIAWFASGVIASLLVALFNA